MLFEIDMTPRPIRVLHLEDSPRDAELIHDRLEAGGIAADIVLVTDRQAFEAALAGATFDLILTDCLPGEDGMAAVRQARERQPRTPVIVVSGPVGEEAAVALLQCGATDYILKQRLDRLVPAVQRALHAAQQRRTREAAEATLHQNEFRFRQLAEQFNVCFWFVTLNPEAVVYVSPAVEAIWGLPQETFYQDSRAWLAAIHPDDRPAVHEAWQACFGEQPTRFEVEYRVIRPDRSVRWVRDRGTLIQDQDGTSAMSGMAVDITDRKNADNDRRQQEERLRISQLAAHCGLFEYSYETGENRWTPELQRLWGFPEGGFGGTSEAWRERIHPDDRADVRRQEEQALATGEYIGEYRVIWPDGSVRWMYARGQVYRDERGQPLRLLGINLDITDRKQLEARFRQAQKMEVVGQLAGGVAHDFNNLITIINGTAELASASLAAGHPLLADLQEIRRAGDRAATLTRQLLAFSRKQILQPQVIDLATLVSQIEPVLRRLIGKDIDLALALGERERYVTADPVQLEQVIVNLALNAREAMPQGGRLTLEVSSVMLDEQYGREHGIQLSPGPYARLTVSDTGVGMDEPTRRRVFEPFFTTKAAGTGTGLGLAAAYGIVKQSAGFVWVDSEVGQDHRCCDARDERASAGGALRRDPAPDEGPVHIRLHR